jgi:hypothetical protein
MTARSTSQKLATVLLNGLSVPYKRRRFPGQVRRCLDPNPCPTRRQSATEHPSGQPCWRRRSCCSRRPHRPYRPPIAALPVLRGRSRRPTGKGPQLTPPGTQPSRHHCLVQEGPHLPRRERLEARPVQRAGRHHGVRPASAAPRRPVRPRASAPPRAEPAPSVDGQLASKQQPAEGTGSVR